MREVKLREEHRDTSGLPPVQNITNKEGRVVLGWLEDPNDPYTEHIDNGTLLMLDHSDVC